MQYELFYLVGASKEAELDTIKKEVADIIATEGGVFEEKQVVEKRKMAYDIKHESRGFYVAQRFSLEDASKLQSITRLLNLYTKILRSIITKTDELPALTSREEREASSKNEDSAKKQKTAQTVPAKLSKTEVMKTSKIETSITQEEASEKAPENPEVTSTVKSIKSSKQKEATENIDKKLEEILNI